MPRKKVEISEESDSKQVAVAEDGPSILMEDGSRRAVKTAVERERRVVTLDGTYCEHVSEAIGGEWVYRQQ